MKKSPIGIEPKNIWESRRFQNLQSAIERYNEAMFPIPVEWIEEYNEFVNRL